MAAPLEHDCNLLNPLERIPDLTKPEGPPRKAAAAKIGRPTRPDSFITFGGAQRHGHLLRARLGVSRQRLKVGFEFLRSSADGDIERTEERVIGADLIEAHFIDQALEV